MKCHENYYSYFHVLLSTVFVMQTQVSSVRHAISIKVSVAYHS